MTLTRRPKDPIESPSNGFAIGPRLTCCSTRTASGTHTSDRARGSLGALRRGRVTLTCLSTAQPLSLHAWFASGIAHCARAEMAVWLRAHGGVVGQRERGRGVASRPGGALEVVTRPFSGG